MEYYTLKKTDRMFLSVPRTDYISQKLLSVGDTICICSGCKNIMLRSSYSANSNHCICGSTRLMNITPSLLDREFKCESVDVAFRHKKKDPLPSTSTRRKAKITSQQNTAVSLNPPRRRFVVHIDNDEPPGTSDCFDVGNLFFDPVADSNPGRAVNNPYPRRKKKPKKGGRIFLNTVVGIVIASLVAVILLSL